MFEHPGWQAADILAKGRRILALEAVQDPGNVGTLLRSAAAFGFDGVLLCQGVRGTHLPPKTLRASMGAAGRLPVAPVQDLPQALQQLRARGVVCLAAALYHSRPLDEAPQSYPDGLCAVIGSEGQGLTDAAVQACDMAVRIPMTDLVESLTPGLQAASCFGTSEVYNKVWTAHCIGCGWPKRLGPAAAWRADFWKNTRTRPNCMAR